MTIYVEVKNCPNLSMGYEAEVVPRVGETISITRGNISWRVLAVDHLIGEKLTSIHDLNLKVVTIIVEQQSSQKRCKQ